MRRALVLLAAVPLLALATPAAVAAPSPTPAPTGTDSLTSLPCGISSLYNWQVNSTEFTNPTHDWAESIPVGNWYLSQVNTTDITPHDSSTCYQLLADHHFNNLCLTYSGGATGGQILDETCNPGQASQEWDVVYVDSTHEKAHFQSQYLQSKYPNQCPSAHAQFIRAQTATAALNMACPQSNGSPWQSQVFETVIAS